jgi:hypothetical protein
MEEAPRDREERRRGRPARTRDELWEEAPALRKLTPKQKQGAVVMRDLAVFQVKLVLDGLKDLVMIWVSIGAAILDVIAPTEQRGRRFYATMRAAERFDRWLNLYGASEVAVDEEEGLFGASRAGADSLLGKLEEMVLGHEEPEESEEPEPESPARPGPPAPRDRDRH